MFYLLLQVVFASTFTLVVKWVYVRKKEDVISVGLFNYIVAALAALPFYFNTESNSHTYAGMLTGGCMGLVYFIAFFFVIYCVRTVGASKTTVVSVLSLLFPIFVAAFVWKEFPHAFQWFGIVVAVVSLLLISLKPTISNASGVPSAEMASAKLITPLALLVFFLLCGCSRIAQETFKHISAPDQRPTFLFSAFGVTASLSIAALLIRRRRLQRNEILMGTFMGLANVLQTQLILKCLELFPGYIVFTVTSAGAIALTSLAATCLLNERVDRIGWIGIALAVASLFILQLE